MGQDNIFLSYEGDNWFQRNKAYMDDQKNLDWTSKLVSMLDVGRIKSVLDLGCSTGYRLDMLKGFLTHSRPRLVGVDASSKAIEHGKSLYPDISFYQGLLSNIPLKDTYDLVIVHSVLHWVDRNSLAKSISEIDRMTEDGGYLIVTDFAPRGNHKRIYHHLPDEKVYTYKQSYADIFLSLGIYSENASIYFSHSNHTSNILTDSHSDERMVSVVMSKSLNEYYPEVEK